MQVKELVAVLIKFIDAELKTRPEFDHILTYGKDQPAQKGAADDAVYIQRLFSRRVGSPSVQFVMAGPESGVEQEEQVMNTTFQISTLYFDEGDVDTPTAKDLAEFVAMGLNSRKFIRILAEKGANILRATDVRDGVFSNDDNQFEFNPSFDVTITHTTTYSDMIAATREVKPLFYRV